MNVVKEKVGKLPLNKCFTLQNNSCNSISNYVVGCWMFIPTWALKQMGT